MGVMDLRRRIMLNEPHIVTTTPAGIANFSTDLISPLKSCKVEFSPVQSGSGDPSPDNVRPISGWTGCNVYRAGKNLFNKTTAITGKFVRAGNTSAAKPLGSEDSNVLWNCSDYIKVMPNARYTTTVPHYEAAGGAGIVFYADQTVESAISGVHTAAQGSTVYSFTTPSTCRYLRFSWSNFDGNDCQLEPGSTATTYEPYTGSTIPIDWTTEAGTVYGGYVDLVTGKLVAEWGIVDISELARWTYSERYGGYFSGLLSGRKYGNNIICSCFQTSSVTYVAGMPDFSILGNATSNAVFVRDPTYTDATEFVAARTGQKLAYQLATPITYQLTPTQLKSLRGVNNIWSDANGDTTVKYWTH